MNNKIKAAPKPEATKPENLLNTLLAAKEAKEAEVDPTPEAAPTSVIEAPAPEQNDLFHYYKSSRPSTRLITYKGLRVVFAGFELLTQDEDVVAYLNHEIKACKGILGITYEGQLTLADKDPMEALRRQHIAEYLEQQGKLASDKAKGIQRSMGETHSVDLSSLSPLTSDQVAK